MEHDTAAMDVDQQPASHLAVPRGIEVPKSPSNVALAGSPAEEREKLLDPYESGPVSSSAMSASSSAQQPTATTVDRLQAVYADDALRRPASVMATTGSPASEREQLLEPAERANMPSSSSSSDAGAAPPLSAPSTPPKRLSALPPHLQRHSALPPLAYPSGPPSPALSIQPGPPTPTGTSLSASPSAPGPGLSVAVDQASGPIRSEEAGPGQSLGASSVTLAPQAPPGAEMTTTSSSERATVHPTSVSNVRNRGDESGKDDTLAPPHPAAPAPRDDAVDINALLEARIRAEKAASDPTFAVPGIPASLSRPPPAPDRHRGLPQDIAHILTSDFAATAPFAPSAEEREAEQRRRLAKDAEVRRMAGEMMARADENGSAPVQEDDESSDDSSTDASSSTDDDGGNGDEKRADRNETLQAIRAEVEAAEKSSSSSSSEFDESELTGVGRAGPGGRKRGRRHRGRGKSNQQAGRGSDSDGDSDDSDTPARNDGNQGLRTEHEVGPEQMAAPSLPFVKVPDEAMAKLVRLGDLASVINNVVVVKGDAAGKAVLDEGSLVCWQDGVVIGRIFETFGAVTSPHYSIRLPTVPSPGPAPGTPVYYVPSHSAFVFTQELSRMPKGSDASNLWDEEVGGYEVEFSDDEQEAEYRRRMKEQRAESVASDSSSWSRGSERGRRGGRGRGRGRGRGGRTSQSPRPDMRVDNSEMMPTGGQDDGYSVLRRPSAPPDDRLDYGGESVPQRSPQSGRADGPAYDPAVPGLSAAPPPPSPGYKRYHMPSTGPPSQPSHPAQSFSPQQQPFFPAQQYYASPQPHVPAFNPTPYQPMPFAPPSPGMHPPPFQQSPAMPGSGGHYNPRFYPQGGPTPPWMFRPPPQ